MAEPVDLETLLSRHAREDESSQVYVPGGYVDRALSVPLQGGVTYLARWATEAWRQCTTQQQREVAVFGARRQLVLAEQALDILVEAGLDKHVAIALAAVLAAKALLR